MVFILLLLNYTIFGQLSLSADAYKIFTDKSSALKAGYLGYSINWSFPVMAEKLTDTQNPAYAKPGIRSVIVVRELNGVKDTLAIRKYNNEGFLVERDTFSWHESYYEKKIKYVSKSKHDRSLNGRDSIMIISAGKTKYVSKTHYDYFLKDKIVKVRLQDIVFKPDTSYEWQESLKMIFIMISKTGSLEKNSGISQTIHLTYILNLIPMVSLQALKCIVQIMPVATC